MAKADRSAGPNASVRHWASRRRGCLDAPERRARETVGRGMGRPCGVGTVNELADWSAGMRCVGGGAPNFQTMPHSEWPGSLRL